MARTREPETEFDPRHRIVGAIVLVTLAVILFPLILDERPNPEIAVISGTDQESSAQTADPVTVKTKKVVVKRLSVNQATSDTSEHTPAPASKPAAPTKVVTTKVESQPKMVAAKTESKSGKSASKSITQPHWAVQVGNFSNQANVRRLKKRLETNGFSVMFKDIRLKQGDAVRVRVGPYTTRASADEAQGKIKQDIGIKGVVVTGP